MAVAAIYNVPGAQSEFEQWAFAHMAHHRDIIRYLYELGAATGGSLDEFSLDPLNPREAGVWLYQHQVMHDQMEAILGIQGYNLLAVDFTNQNELTGWIWLNAQIHYQAGNILGLG